MHHSTFSLYHWSCTASSCIRPSWFKLWHRRKFSGTIILLFVFGWNIVCRPRCCPFRHKTIQHSTEIGIILASLLFSNNIIYFALKGHIRGEHSRKWLRYTNDTPYVGVKHVLFYTDHANIDAILCRNQWYQMLCYVMLCYVMLCYATFCYVMPCYTMWYHVMPCHATPCHTIPCHVISYIISYLIPKKTAVYI